MIWNKIKYFVNLVNLFSVLVLIVILITDNYGIQKIVYFVFFISYVIEFFTDRKWKNFTWNKKKMYFLLMLLFFTLALFYYPFESSHQYFKLLMERRYPLLGFSVVGFWGVNHLYKLRYFIISVVSASLLVIIYLLFFKVGIPQFFEDKNLFNLARSKYVNTHMIVNFYFNTAIIGIWYLLSSYWNRINIFNKSALVISLFLFLYALSISDGRSGFLFGLALTMIIAFSELWKKKKKFGIIFGFVIPLISTIAIATHQRMDYEVVRTEPRYFLWHAGLDVIKEKPLLGHGISMGQNQYNTSREKYETKEFKANWIQSKHIDSHNQYIQTGMEFGLIGLVLLLYIYIMPYFLIIKRRKKIMFFFIALCLFQSVFDMFVTGFFSAIFCLWIVFLLNTGNERRENNQSELKEE